MRIRALLCVLLGHQPYDYEVQETHRNTLEFTECSRCHARKNLTGTGWIHGDD